MARTTKLVPPAKSVCVCVNVSLKVLGVKFGRCEEVTGQLVELESECDGEEEELVGDDDEQCDGKIVVVQDVDGAIHVGQLEPQ